AASGVPWLASPIGPYVGLGGGQGGRLVPDDQWFEAMEQMVTNERERRELAGNAETWARGQMIETAADRWEQVLADAAGREAAAPPTGSAFALKSGVTVRLQPPAR